jgi:hypothetical protein
MGFQASTTLNMKIAFWYVTPYALVESVRGTCCTLRVEGIETVGSSKTSITFYQTTLHHISEDSNLQKRVCFSAVGHVSFPIN